jgi:large subunit ribosomal protein L35
MPKMKTHKASVKRFRVTRRGKVMAFPTGRRHVMSGVKSKKRRHLRRARPLKKADRRHTLKALHYHRLIEKPEQKKKPEAVVQAAPTSPPTPKEQ